MCIRTNGTDIFIQIQKVSIDEMPIAIVGLQIDFGIVFCSVFAMYFVFLQTLDCGHTKDTNHWI